MSPKFKNFLQRWLINAAGVAVASRIVSGIQYGTLMDLAVASFLLGLLNAFVRPFLMLLSLPIMIFTLGLFTFVINALLLYAVGWLIYPKFEVASFGAAFWGALVITLMSLFLNSLTGTGSSRIQIRRSAPPRPPSEPGNPPDGSGPVIDV